MSLYILDTDTLTLFNWNHPKVLQNVLAQLHDEIAVTVLSVEEQLSGWHRALRQTKQTSQLTVVYQRMTDTIESLRYFPIYSKLGVKKMDLRIGAIALESKGRVVTRNQRDFGRIPGLAIEDWSK